MADTHQVFTHLPDTLLPHSPVHLSCVCLSHAGCHEASVARCGGMVRVVEQQVGRAWRLSRHSREERGHEEFVLFRYHSAIPLAARSSPLYPAVPSTSRLSPVFLGLHAASPSFSVDPSGSPEEELL
ncbi:hypothetical protein E2C01_063830 [Portunus trituberculatus]|uniref:Uncharacterized protein n=1 Tax=Portunus trituberculatus TaxID=210409 RepID=A0A5B7HBJ6_PORTR|nr:hypothetical protein [Portunus trituberculatus]